LYTETSSRSIWSASLFARYCLILDLGFAGLTAIMTLVLLVVLMIYMIYMQESPILHDELPYLLKSIGVLLLLTLTYAVSAWMLHRQLLGRWLMQAMALIFLAALLWRVLGAS
jgi:uncharacterized BrkB/YihY/UPF0761 family membrane protein